MKRLNGLDKYVIFSISILLIYSVAEFISVTITGIEKQTLTTCIYACFGGEILSCALIKIFKLSEKDDDDADIDT